MSRAAVLVVEDEAIVAADIMAKLRLAGYSISGYTARGDEAVELASTLRPDVVLMDIKLLGPVDGVTAAEAIRRQYGLPVVFLSAHSDRASLERMRISEPFGYVLKPFDEGELERQIEAALERHRSRGPAGNPLRSENGEVR